MQNASKKINIKIRAGEGQGQNLLKKKNTQACQHVSMSVFRLVITVLTVSLFEWQNFASRLGCWAHRSAQPPPPASPGAVIAERCRLHHWPLHKASSTALDSSSLSPVHCQRLYRLTSGFSPSTLKNLIYQWDNVAKCIDWWHPNIHFLNLSLKSFNWVDAQASTTLLFQQFKTVSIGLSST